MLRWLTAGESHGPELVAVIEGLPAGVEITEAEIQNALARRRLGYGRGARMKFEADALSVSGGLRHGVTQGGPVALRVGNTEWPKWEKVMSPWPVDPEELTGARAAALTRPRPGHADLTGMQKYNFDDARPVLERASARETAARVALGAVARAFLRALNVEVLSHTVAIETVEVPLSVAPPRPGQQPTIDEDPMRCAHAETSELMVERVDRAHKSGDTLGGVVEVVVWGLPPGLGSYVQWDRRLDGRLTAALMGIQAIKGVEVGDGFHTTRVPGSQAHDEIAPGEEGAHRVAHHSGGIEGGMSTGEVLRVRAGMKPIATVPQALKTIDTSSGEAAQAHHQRSDVCAVPAAGVVAEAMVSLVLAQAVLEKFGGDSLDEVRRNIDGYLAAIPEALKTAPDQTID
jgi:chorismate synthase